MRGRWNGDEGRGACDMGAGKSTVGRLLADALGWGFVDLDDEIGRRSGAPVHEIIRQRGLDHFRRREAEVGREVLRRRHVVVSVGGGWPAHPGNMESLGDDAASIWLRVGVAPALERIAASTSVRPLLQVPEGRSPDQVLQAILGLLAATDNGSDSGSVERRKGDSE